jgi:hypothetical protein
LRKRVPKRKRKRKSKRKRKRKRNALIKVGFAPTSRCNSENLMYREGTPLCS